MSFNQKSAGGRVATDSAAQSGVNADSFNGEAAHSPHASAGACTRNGDALDEVFSDLRCKLRRITVVAEASAALLEQLRGSEIDRDDTLAVFSLIEELGRNAQRIVNEIQPMAFAPGEVLQ